MTDGPDETSPPPPSPDGHANGDGGTPPPGRTARGTFSRGNQIAKGRANPLASNANKLRAMLHSTVTPDDWRAMITALIKRARRGDVRAFREIANRLVGKPVACDTRESLELLTAGEEVIAARMTAVRRLDLIAARADPDDERLSEREADMLRMPKPQLHQRQPRPLAERRRVKSEVVRAAKENRR